MLRLIERYPRINYQRWNGIANLFTFTCKGHFFALVRTFLPPAGELAASFLVVDPDDLLRGWLKGSGYRSRLKMFGRSGRSRRAYEIPEIGEEIGERLPLAGKLAGTRLGKGLRWLFMLDDFVQGVLRWFVLYDQITKFLQGWSSGLLQVEECRLGGVYTRGGDYGAPGGERIQQIPLAGAFTEVISAGAEDGSVYLAGNEIRADVPVQFGASISMDGVFPLGCHFVYRYFWMNERDEVVFRSLPVSSDWGVDNYTTSVSWFVPPGRYRLFYELWSSGCYTAMLHFGWCVVKPWYGGR